MKQHTNMTIHSYRKREENKEEKESVMKHSRVSIAGDSVHVAMDSVTYSKNENHTFLKSDKF
jgi:hypothetical protein